MTQRDAVRTLILPNRFAIDEATSIEAAAMMLVVKKGTKHSVFEVELLLEEPDHPGASYGQQLISGCMGKYLQRRKTRCKGI